MGFDVLIKTKEILPKIFAIFLGLIFTFMDSISFGSLIIPADALLLDNENTKCLSRFLFLLTTVVSQFIFSSRSKISTGIISGFIVETLSYYGDIFKTIKDKNQSPKIIFTNSLVCTSISTFLFALLSLIIPYFNLTKIIESIPASIISGCLGGIGISQIITSFSEVKSITKNVNESVITADYLDIILIGIIFLASATCLYLQSKFPNSSLIVPIFTLFLLFVFYITLFPINNFDINSMQNGLWLPKNINLTDQLVLFSEYFSFDAINLEYVQLNIWNIIYLALFCLIHLPINLTTYSEITGTEVDIHAEFYAQALANFIGMFTSGPSYFICTNSYFFMMAGGKSKILSFVLAISNIFLFRYINVINVYVPTLMIAFFPFFVGLSICKSVFYDAYKKFWKTEKYNFCFIVFTAAISCFWNATIGILIATFLYKLLLMLNRNENNMENHL